MVMTGPFICAKFTFFTLPCPFKDHISCHPWPSLTGPLKLLPLFVGDLFGKLLEFFLNRVGHFPSHKITPRVSGACFLRPLHPLVS